VAVDRFALQHAMLNRGSNKPSSTLSSCRYMDLPVFLDVASVVSGYSILTGVSVNGTLSTDQAVQGNLRYCRRPGHLHGSADHHLRADDRDKFLRGLITPLDPKNIFFLLQSGLRPPTSSWEWH
jgi:hypothetical protein